MDELDADGLEVVSEVELDENARMLLLPGGVDPEDYIRQLLEDQNEFSDFD